MVYNLLADIIVIIHFLFAVFALFGGLLIIKWRRVIWLHIPAMIWGALVEFSGWICPLTPLENWLRLQAGATAYTGDFIQHYLMPILYPSFLTRELQIIFGIIVVGLNLVIYSVVIYLGLMARNTQQR